MNLTELRQAIERATIPADEMYFWDLVAECERLRTWLPVLVDVAEAAQSLVAYCQDDGDRYPKLEAALERLEGL